MEYYSGIKKNDVMLFARKCTELKIILLSEISQTERQMQNAKNIKPLFGGKNQWEGKG
jgi:hypothetical protein